MPLGVGMSVIQQLWTLYRVGLFCSVYWENDQYG
jgi:hypothetical protein